jgi:hypothetical protein
VPEHDSAGEFIFLVAEVFRYQDDRALAESMWPRVDAAAAYLDSLRQLRRTDPYQHDENAVFFGLLPASISHEGYAAKPMHSYWDDFWALRGFADAAWLARKLGQPEAQAHWDSVHAEFAHDLRRSIERSMHDHGIDYVPGCAELGDFDPTSTTIALSPTRGAVILPPAVVEQTFERYWRHFVERRDGAPWERYTPYELRNVGAFVQLGWRDRAQELLDWFRQHQRPAGWNHWAEVVAADARQPSFLGDMPHTWVGTDFVRSILDMLALEPIQTEDALVLAAGIPRGWIEEDPGLSVRGLQTPYGTVDMTARIQGDRIRVEIGDGLGLPPGGLWLVIPLETSPSGIWVDGLRRRPDPNAPLGADREALRLQRVPTTIEIQR